MLAQLLIASGAGLILLLGLAHLVFTYAGNRLHPRERDVLDRLKTAQLVISRRASFWDAWIGFNASHSLGAIMFGLVYGYLALRQPLLLLHSAFLASIGLLALLAYLLMAKRYWFHRPFQGIALALLLYAAGLLAAHAGS